MRPGFTALICVSELAFLTPSFLAVHTHICVRAVTSNSPWVIHAVNPSWSHGEIFELCPWLRAAQAKISSPPPLFFFSLKREGRRCQIYQTGWLLWVWQDRMCCGKPLEQGKTEDLDKWTAVFVPLTFKVLVGVSSAAQRKPIGGFLQSVMARGRRATASLKNPEALAWIFILPPFVLNWIHSRRRRRRLSAVRMLKFSSSTPGKKRLFTAVAWKQDKTDSTPALIMLLMWLASS